MRLLVVTVIAALFAGGLPAVAQAQAPAPPPEIDAASEQVADAIDQLIEGIGQIPGAIDGVPPPGSGPGSFDLIPELLSDPMNVINVVLFAVSCLLARLQDLDGPPPPPCPP